jgi:hypothetical protein
MDPLAQPKPVGLTRASRGGISRRAVHVGATLGTYGGSSLCGARAECATLLGQTKLLGRLPCTTEAEPISPRFSWVS